MRPSWFHKVKRDSSEKITWCQSACHSIWKNVLFNPTIMPTKRSAIGRSKKQAKRRREERASETSEQRKTRQERD
ncbi:hypothetical protein TNCV_955141 [Trichonephila clavipes]|nr:hypothetical protein TNCV_955141 [Trichonephila clavipes]